MHTKNTGNSTASFIVYTVVLFLVAIAVFLIVSNIWDSILTYVK